MEQWWNALTAIQKVYWGIATFSTIIFICQTITLLLGIGDDGDADSDGGMEDFDTDGDIDGDGDDDYQESSTIGYFTIRNMIAFLLGFSWVGIICLKQGLSESLSIPISITAGLLFALITIGLMYALSKLKSSGNISLSEAVGKEAMVSIMIPKNGQGKVKLTLNEKLIENEAVSNVNETLRKGQKVKILSVSNGTLKVQKT